MPWVTSKNVSLLTDLYELTMAASYFARRMDHRATFELFVRRLPQHRNFLVACGIQDAVEYLEGLSFDEDAIAFLRSLGLFADDFLEYLARLRFTGDVWAVPEGELVFDEEPILRVTAPLIQAQIVETFLLNCVTFQTMIASKAARVALACGDRAFVDFSPRRDHGADAALKAARAAYVGGAAATSNVLAGQVYGLPLSGTMAHSYVMSFEQEIDAFRSFARDFPGRSILLIDTYDTVQGARRAVAVAHELRGEGITIQGVRLDSGDIADLARQVRTVLDEGGCGEAQIFASGDLDEYRIAELVASQAPVDAFGVGTQLGTSADAPALGGVYKLVEDERGPRLKRSPGKATLPGRKQIHRFESDGQLSHDVLALEGEVVIGGRALLWPILAEGRSLTAQGPLEAARRRCREALGALPGRLRLLHGEREPYEVRHSPGIRDLVARLSDRPW